MKYLDFTSCYTQIQHTTGPGLLICQSVKDDSLVTITNVATIVWRFGNFWLAFIKNLIPLKKILLTTFEIEPVTMH